MLNSQAVELSLMCFPFLRMVQRTPQQSCRISRLFQERPLTILMLAEHGTDKKILEKPVVCREKTETGEPTLLSVNSRLPPTRIGSMERPWAKCCLGLPALLLELRGACASLGTLPLSEEVQHVLSLLLVVRGWGKRFSPYPWLPQNWKQHHCFLPRQSLRIT